MHDLFRNQHIASQCDALDDKLTYLKKALSGKENVGDGIIAVSLFSALARVLKSVSDRFVEEVVVCIMGAGDEAEQRRQAALDIAQALLSAGEVQILLLATGSSITLPKAQEADSDSGGIGLGLTSIEEEKLSAARAIIVKEFNWLVTFIEQNKPIDESAKGGKFLSALVKSNLTSKSKVDAAVEAAFVSSES